MPRMTSTTTTPAVPPSPAMRAGAAAAAAAARGPADVDHVAAADASPLHRSAKPKPVRRRVERRAQPSGEVLPGVGAGICSRSERITPRRPFSSSAVYIRRTRSKTSPATSSWRSRLGACLDREGERLAELHGHLGEAKLAPAHAPRPSRGSPPARRALRTRARCAPIPGAARRGCGSASVRPRRRRGACRPARGSRRRS